MAEVTVRTSRNHWQDIAGRYESGAWRFDLNPGQFSGAWEFKFVLDRSQWMQDPNLAVNAIDGLTRSFGEDEVQFAGYRKFPVREYGQVQRLYFERPAVPADPYEVIVIGSGIGGGVLADELSDLGHKVLVVEAGGFLFPTHIANLPRRQHTEREKLVKHIWEVWQDFQTKQYYNLDGSNYQGGYGFNLGGRSLFWGALMPRMTSWELDFWGRDVKWALEDEYYQRAEDVIGRSTQPRTLYTRKVFQMLRELLPDYNHVDAPVSMRQNPVGANTISTGVFSTADLLMESSLTGGREGKLQISLNHMVERVVEQGGRSVAVLARDLKTGEVRTYRGKYAVLCAGTIESARLALRSGLQPSELIGKGLTDHAVYFRHFRLPRSSKEFFDPYTSTKTLSQPREREGASREPFNILLEINADLNQGRYLDDDLLDELLDRRGEWVLGEIVFLLNAELKEDNFVRIATDGERQAQVSMREVHVPATVEHKIEELTHKVIGRLGGEIFKSGRGELGAVAHEVGTLRMQRTKGAYVDAHGPQPGVLDEQLRFLGHERLFACDLSVFPTSPAANPTLTLAALAIRLGKHLHKKLSS
jgi:choline dehydrogenase-like flavoprotein